MIDTTDASMGAGASQERFYARRRQISAAPRASVLTSAPGTPRRRAYHRLPSRSQLARGAPRCDRATPRPRSRRRGRLLVRLVARCGSETYGIAPLCTESSLLSGSEERDVECVLNHAIGLLPRVSGHRSGASRAQAGNIRGCFLGRNGRAAARVVAAEGRYV